MIDEVLEEFTVAETIDPAYDYVDSVAMSCVGCEGEQLQIFHLRKPYLQFCKHRSRTNVTAKGYKDNLISPFPNEIFKVLFGIERI